jgi:sugar/nucleoside kinase (ribokinase family)
MRATGCAYSIVGDLTQDFCISHTGRAHLGVLGGHASYAAAGARLWSDSVGLLARVEASFPQSLLDTLQAMQVSTEAVRRVDVPAGYVRFFAYTKPDERTSEHPASHFRRVGLELPKQLVNYQPPRAEREFSASLGPLAYRPEDLPADLGGLRGVHLTPAEFGTHVLLPDRLRERKVPLVTLDPSPAYMLPAHLEGLRTVVHGLDAFLPSLEDTETLFLQGPNDPREIAEAFGDMGCRFVVVKLGERGQLVLDASAQRAWSVPAYAVQVVDVHGAGDVFSGGFLVGLDQTSDPVEAALMGTVASSLAIEGSGPGYLLDSLPGLAQARLQALRPSVRRL